MNLPTNNQFSNGLDVRQRSNPFWWMSRSEAMIWYDVFEKKQWKTKKFFEKRYGKHMKTYEHMENMMWSMCSSWWSMIPMSFPFFAIRFFGFRGKLLVGWKNDFKEILFSEEDRRGTEKEGTWHEGTGDMKDLKDMRLGEGSREVNRNGGNRWRLQVFWKILWCQNCFLVCRFILQQMFNLTESLQRQFQKNAWNSRNSPKVSDGEHALKSAESIEDDILLVAEELPLHPNGMICRALSADFSCSFHK